jgi:hypothetical protein
LSGGLPPYVPDGDEEWHSQEYASKLKRLLEEGRRGDAVELFMTTVGMPLEAVAQMRIQPWWAGLEAVAPTLAYDFEIMGDVNKGGTIPTDLIGRVTAPALVRCGASPAWMIDVGKQIAEVLPNGRHGVLAGQEHVVPPGRSSRCWPTSSPLDGRPARTSRLRQQGAASGGRGARSV